MDWQVAALSLLTNNLRESERFLNHAGSDCGIAHVNIITSGAEFSEPLLKG